MANQFVKLRSPFNGETTVFDISAETLKALLAAGFTRADDLPHDESPVKPRRRDQTAA